MTWNPQCGKCRYWQSLDKEMGKCRRSPPVAMPFGLFQLGQVMAELLLAYQEVNNIEQANEVDLLEYFGDQTARWAEWPGTAAEHWCGEFEQRGDI